MVEDVSLTIDYLEGIEKRVERSMAVIQGCDEVVLNRNSSSLIKLMEKFRRYFKINKESSSTKSKQRAKGQTKDEIQSRNPFLHYLNAYRTTVRDRSRSIWSTTAEAAKRWDEMTMEEKTVYIEKAHHCYHLRDRYAQHVLRHLRRALADESKLNVKDMVATIRMMQLWRRNPLMDVLESD
uniref:HMG box domain-containing protein n=1 Tax=Glossina austeni TaxID=7395 RepID=A0A1A9VF24_GLOAU